jgi:hypothetical protein
VIGVAAKRLIRPQEAYIYIPAKLVINRAKLLKSEIKHVFEDHKEEFKTITEDDRFPLTFFVAYEMAKGESSFWYPYFSTAYDSDIPLFWDPADLEFLDDELIKAEIELEKQTFQEEEKFCLDLATKTLPEERRFTSR